MTKEPEVRIRRSSEEVQQLMIEFKNSGMSASEFCEKHGLCRSSLYRYLSLSRSGKKLQRKNKAQATTSQIVPVELAPARQARQEEKYNLALVLASGHKIEVPGGFDEAALERLLAVLERR